MESHNEARIAEHDGSLPTVLMIVGSLRKQSFNRQLAQLPRMRLQGARM